MSEKIAVLTDSTCDIPAEIMEERNIEFLPLKVIYQDGEYLDRIDIQPSEIYDYFAQEIPSTSMPGPEDFKKFFNKLKNEGYTHIISIHISSGLSATYNIGKMAAKEIEGVEIEVIDSKGLSMALGRLVLYADDLIKEQELGFKQIVKKVKDKVQDIDVFFVVKTLKYLKEGGRIGKISGTIGELLSIKPIISIDDEGVYYNYDKARGRKKSLKKLQQIVKDKISSGLFTVDVMHANAREEAEKLFANLKDLPNIKDSYFGEISPVMAVHAGPGLIGVAILKLNN